MINKTSQKAAAAKQKREQKQLKKDIAEANKHFLNTLFKTLHDE